VLGLGRIGTLVAQRAHAFGMRLVAWDPWMAPERARQLGIELLDLDELMATADFVSIHLNKSKDSAGLIGEDLLAKAKPGIRIVNAARGGIVDEAALAQAIKNGTVAGAGLDVFDTEPTTESPLFALDSVVVTPHLAASTREAQDKAGQVIAEQVILALAGDFVPFAINVEASEANEAVRSYLPLAERLGRLYALLNEGLPPVLDIEYQGELGSYDTRILTLSLLKGLLSAGCDEPVSYVNAPSLASERGMEVRETKTTAVHDYLNLLAVRGGDHGIGATLFGLRGEPRIVMIDDHDIELPLAANLLVVRNDDRVGMMAIVTTAVAGAGVNIADMRLGRSPAGGTALAAITSDDPFPPELREELSHQPGILDVRLVNQG
ncbi:MAG: phosphoglycerate dehydrogenase, partial [Actinobacteria bacterium]|nr:phosphoglycerate dehydrogenase [Actinomycetota bacterium]MBW3651504.1 phosphoglycerate dehydrogenase [Actinomycetota bacterium]